MTTTEIRRVHIARHRGLASSEDENIRKAGRFMEEVIKELHRLVEHLDTTFTQLKDLRSKWQAIQAVEEVKKELLDVLDGMHSHLYEQMRGKVVDLGWDTVLERTTSTQKVWDDEAVFNRLRMKVVNLETGEVDLQKLLEFIQSAAKIAYWRKGVLNDLGVEVDEDLVETRFGKKRVRFKR